MQSNYLPSISQEQVHEGKDISTKISMTKIYQQQFLLNYINFNFVNYKKKLHQIQEEIEQKIPIPKSYKKFDSLQVQRKADTFFRIIHKNHTNAGKYIQMCKFIQLQNNLQKSEPKMSFQFLKAQELKKKIKQKLNNNKQFEENKNSPFYQRIQQKIAQNSQTPQKNQLKLISKDIPKLLEELKQQQQQIIKTKQKIYLSLVTLELLDELRNIHENQKISLEKLLNIITQGTPLTQLYTKPISGYIDGFSKKQLFEKFDNTFQSSYITQRQLVLMEVQLEHELTH